MQKVELDTREQKMREFLKSKWTELEVEEKQLPIGDVVCPEKSLCIERKNIEDFVSSLTENGGERLFTQALNMKNSYPNRYLIIVGSFTKYEKSLQFSGRRGIGINHFLGAIASLTAKYGIPVLNVENKNQYATLVQSLILKFGEAPDFQMIKRLQFTEDSKKKALLTLIDGISTERATRILGHFGSVREVLNAKEEDLLSIKGIGKKMAKNVVEELHNLIEGEVEKNGEVGSEGGKNSKLQP